MNGWFGGGSQGEWVRVTWFPPPCMQGGGKSKVGFCFLFGLVFGLFGGDFGGVWLLGGRSGG